jgi:hypothetical protein
MKRKIIATAIWIFLWVTFSCIQCYPQELSYTRVIIFEVVTITKTVVCLALLFIISEKTGLL